MILLIDNYDSFSYNLVQLVGNISEDILVIRNDEMTVDEIKKLTLSHIIISPGPGRPKDAGICEKIIKELKGKVPILGVCLGHQAICEVFGMEIDYAKKLIHGKQDEIQIDPKEKIFKGLNERIKVARYHSLVGKKRDLKVELKIIGEDDNGEIMAVKHKDHEIYGVQFHPESILTPNGGIIIKNFLDIKLEG